MGKLDDWLEKHFGGHVTIGPLTIYGFNAMHLAMNLRTKRWGTICFHPSLRFLGAGVPWHLREHPWSFFLSPNCTPWASTFLLGPRFTRLEKLAALRRWVLWGHGYDSELYDPHKEQEFFDNYVAEMKGDLDEQCANCEADLTFREAMSSNVCHVCLVNELARRVEEEEDDGEPVKMEFRGDGKTPWGKVTQ